MVNRGLQTNIAQSLDALRVPSDPVLQLTVVTEFLDSTQAPFRERVQSMLDAIVEANSRNRDLFPSIDDKKRFAKVLQTLLDKLSLTLLTPSGEPARIDGYGKGGTKGGGFRFRTRDGTNIQAGPPAAPEVRPLNGDSN